MNSSSKSLLPQYKIFAQLTTHKIQFKLTLQNGVALPNHIFETCCRPFEIHLFIKCLAHMQDCLTNIIIIAASAVHNAYHLWSLSFRHLTWSIFNLEQRMPYWEDLRLCYMADWSAHSEHELDRQKLDALLIWSTN